MASNVQDLSSARDKISSDLGGPLLDNNDFLLPDAFDNVNFEGWLSVDEEGNFDTTLRCARCP